MQVLDVALNHITQDIMQPYYLQDPEITPLERKTAINILAIELEERLTAIAKEMTSTTSNTPEALALDEAYQNTSIQYYTICTLCS